MNAYPVAVATPRTESTHQRLYEFAKTALIKIFVHPYATVCDLYCGGGVDADKWDGAQISHYIGIDASSSGISEIREAWESQRKNYTAEFFEADPCTDNLEMQLQEKANQADLVCCLQHLQLCFETEEKARKLLCNVSSLLKPGGYFFGITPDSSTIWAKYQKNVEAYHNRSSSMKPNIVPNCIRSESYMITFEVEEEKFRLFGKKYQLKFASDISAETHCLVHFPSLIRPASLLKVTGVHDSSLKLKLQISVRHFSSAEPPSHTVLGMPALSPTMNQGNIAKWRKKEGDKIEVGDVLCEIETDKATLEFESLEEGFLAKILVPEGSKDVPVGQPIAVTVEDQDDIQNIPATFGGESEIKGEKSTHQVVKNDNRVQETSSVKINSSELPPHVVLGMPALSPTMNQGNIAKWRKKEGDKIEVGDVICEIETDKATLEFECLEEGYLAKIIAPEGSKDVAVGQPIAVTVEDPDDIETVQTSVSSGSVVKGEKPAHRDSKNEVSAQKASFTKISPSAKLLISEYGLDTSSLKASGPHGTLLKGDVLSAIKSGKVSSRTSSPKEEGPPLPQTRPQTSTTKFPESKSHPQRSDSFEDFPNSQIRKIIARRLLESKHNTPHLYLSSDVILDPLLAFRKELKEQHDVKVSVNDIVIKAVAIALKNVPDANAYWNVEKGEAILCDSVDISIAVATEKGLMTPIIRNADQKSISSISLEVKELAEKARTGKLAPNEFQGGTFSISNLGMFPVDQFCAIINPPQAGILAVGRGNKVAEPVIGSDGIERPAIITKMNLTLSADHRVFDGQVGGAFLSALRSNFSDIRRLLL